MRAASEIIKWKQYCYAYNIFLCPSITHIPIKFCVFFFFLALFFSLKFSVAIENCKIQLKQIAKQTGIDFGQFLEPEFQLQLCSQGHDIAIPKIL